MLSEDSSVTGIAAVWHDGPHAAATCAAIINDQSQFKQMSTPTSPMPLNDVLLLKRSKHGLVELSVVSVNEDLMKPRTPKWWSSPALMPRNHAISPRKSRGKQRIRLKL